LPFPAGSGGAYHDDGLESPSGSTAGRLPDAAASILLNSSSAQPLSPVAPKLTLRTSLDSVPPVPIAQLPATLSAMPDFNDVIRACWQQRGRDRPSAAELLTHLQGLLAMHGGMDAMGSSSTNGLFARFSGSSGGYARSSYA
jgi:hypothetical protein